MKILNLAPRTGLRREVQAKYLQFNNLLKEVEKKELPDSLLQVINQRIAAVNTETEDALPKALKTQQAYIIKVLEKEAKIVPRHYYRNLWLPLGMATFGLPMGVAFGSALGNMAFMGLGLPIGMGVGIAVGTGIDNKAFHEGRQLDIEIK